MQPLARVLSSVCLGVLTAAVTQSTFAADIVSTAAVWPTAPAVETVDALVNTPANRGITGTRVNRQSFTVLSDFTVSTIFISAANYNSNAFTISFFETSDVNGNPLDLSGAQVGSTITVNPLAYAVGGNMNLEISLGLPEQVFLPAPVGPAGYIMAIQLADTTSAAAFNWVHSNSGVDIYTGGRYRRDDGNQTNTRDFGLALVAVPEPGSLALTLLGAGGLLALRRRRASR